MPHTLKFLQSCELSFAFKAAGQVAKYWKYWQKMTVLLGRWDTSQLGVFADWRLPGTVTLWPNITRLAETNHCYQCPLGCAQFLFVVSWVSPYQQPAGCWSFLEMLALIKHSSENITSGTAISCSQALSSRGATILSRLCWSQLGTENFLSLQSPSEADSMCTPSSSCT